MRQPSRATSLTQLVRGRSGVEKSALALILSTTGSATLGIGFWSLAARLYSPTSVGRGSAEISLMILLANLAQLNLSEMFVRFLPGASNARRLIGVGYAASTLLALVGVLVFVLTPLSSRMFKPSHTFGILFVIAVPLWTIFIVQDGALVGLRRAAWVPVENIMFGVLKLALLGVMVKVTRTEGIFLAWTLPVTLAVGGVSGALFTLFSAHDHREVGYTPEVHGRHMLSYGAAGYLTSFVSLTPAYLLPLIMTWKLGPAANAHFYLPWLSWIVFTNTLWNVSSVFIVDAIDRPNHFQQAFLHCLRIMAIATIFSVAVLAIFGAKLLGLISASYQSSGSVLLELLVMSFPFAVVTRLFRASLWIRGKVWAVFVYELAESSAVVLILFLLLSHFGLRAAGIAELITVISLAALTGPYVIRWYRGRLAIPPVSALHGNPHEVPPTSPWLP
jgi:O-antigen/teichoic acid export membrane protein